LGNVAKGRGDRRVGRIHTTFVVRGNNEKKIKSIPDELSRESIVKKKKKTPKRIRGEPSHRGAPLPFLHVKGGGATIIGLNKTKGGKIRRKKEFKNTQPTPGKKKQKARVPKNWGKAGAVREGGVLLGLKSLLWEVVGKKKKRWNT